MVYAAPDSGRISISFPLRYTRDAVFLAVSYLVVMWVSEKFIPHPATLFPAAAIALAVLFFEGIELWPVLYLTSLVGYFLLDTQPIFLLVLPVAQTLQSVAGAYLLRITKFDPMIRRSRDIVILIVISFVISLIVPTLTSWTNDLSTIFFHTNNVIAAWSARYIGTFFCYLILGSFLLRWSAKVRFVRNWLETLETVVIFAIIIGINYVLFIDHKSIFLGIPLLYVLLLPLFWTALRLRPRFVTLAFLITSIFAVVSLYLGPFPGATGTFTTQLTSIEELISVLAIIFLLMVSLEEDRSLNANIMRSQMATLENAIVRISSESNAKNSFIAILAHELRNPLAPVASAIDFLRMKGNRDPQEEEALATMDSSMQTVRRLLDDLLDISRISEGKITVKHERVQLQAVIKRAIVSTTHHLRENHQALSFKSTQERLYVNGDPVRLEQIFSNLITNASKYSDPGDPITITLRRVDDQAKIVVADTGIGISAEALDKIFTPFHQAETGVRSSKGLGIGLALVRSFVEMHDGTISASSKGNDQGSEFTVMLPLMQDMPPDTTAGTASSASKKPSQTHMNEKKSLHVLVVDDNDAAASGMGRLLEMKGCQVSYAYDGQQAIAQSQAVHPDVILLDIGLPDQDGYSVAKMIRAWGFTGRLIALTGYSTEDARKRGENAGFDHYLIKPIGFNEIKEVLPELI